MQTKTNNPAGTLPTYPVLAPGYELIPMPDGAINLRHWQRSMVLQGQAAQLVARLVQAMDGRSDIAQLAEAMRVPSKLLIQLLIRLQQADLIEDAQQLLPPTHHHFGVATSLGIFSQESGHNAYQKLQHKTVLVVGYDELATQVAQTLQKSGVGRVFTGMPSELDMNKAVDADLFIHVQRGADYKTASHLNEVALSQNINWLSAWIEGRSAIVTHVMTPGETACFECLLLRQRSNYPNLDADLAYENHLRQVEAKLDLQIQETLPAVDHILVGLVAMRSADYLGGWRPAPPVPKLFALSLTQSENMQHPVLRLPHCPVCGPANLQQPVTPFASETVPVILECVS